MPSRSRLVVLASVIAVLSACEQKSDTSQAKEVADAGVEKPKSKVEQALANAVKAGGAPAAVGTSGPPADGIMESTRAESEAPSGAAPKLSVGGEGAGPKFLLRSDKAVLPKNLSMELSIQAGMDQGLPPISVSLGLESKKADSGTAALSVVAKIRDIQVTMPNVPAEFTQQLAGLKGSKVSFSLSAQGAGFGFSAELPKTAKPELRDLLDAVTDGIALLTVPVPSAPVGAGAFWMVPSREIVAGFGFISYRMVKVRSVTEKGAELEYDGRRYAVGRAIDPSLLPPGSPPALLKEMAAAAKATFKISVDRAIATEMDGNSAMRGAIDAGDAPGPQGQPNQRVLQSGTGYRISAK